MEVVVVGQAFANSKSAACWGWRRRGAGRLRGRAGRGFRRLVCCGRRRRLGGVWCTFWSVYDWGCGGPLDLGSRGFGGGFRGADDVGK